jgi:DNA-binding NtrC family response regulator
MNNNLRRRVLVVDDARLIADSLVLVLKSHGFRAEAAYNEEQALALASTMKPDILLGYVIMGEMDGIQLALAIRTIAPSCKTVLIARQGTTESLIRQTEVNGHHFDLLIKPVHPKRLIRILEAL